MAGQSELTVLREIADGARVDPTARIGEFCCVGPHVAIGPRTALHRRVSVCGHTTIGADNVILDGSVLGAVPQDLKYHGRETYLIVGDRNRLGTNVTAHVGTEMGGYLTRIGDDNVLEAGVHVAHDCYVDDRTHLASGVLLAGHVRVESGAVIDPLTGAHHFTTIGRFSRVAARTPIRRDVPPFVLFSSLGYYTSPPAVLGPDEDGMERAGLSETDKAQLRRAIRQLFLEGRALEVKLVEMSAADLCPAVVELCEFCRRSLSGQFGRHRELFRGRIPPETRQFLPPEVLERLGERAGQ